MSTKKASSFWVAFFALLLLYIMTMIMAPASLPAVGPTIVMAIAVAGGMYQGSQVADGWQKSKYYRSELDEKTSAASPPDGYKGQ
jgi:hypothetical protein